MRGVSSHPHASPNELVLITAKDSPIGNVTIAPGFDLAKLANDGHDTRAIQAYLGHRSIMSTVRYTALTPNRFKNFWKD